MDPAREMSPEDNTQKLDAATQQSQRTVDQPRNLSASPSDPSASVESKEAESSQRKHDVEAEQSTSNDEDGDDDTEEGKEKQNGEEQPTQTQWYKVPCSEQEGYPPNTFYYMNAYTRVVQWEDPDEDTWLFDPVNQAPVPNGFIPKSSMTAAYDNVTDSTDVTEPANADYSSTMTLNRFTGRTQIGEGAERHTDEAKSNRQLGAFFDVEKAANAHGGRSLKEERRQHVPSKKEIRDWKRKKHDQKRKRILAQYK